MALSATAVWEVRPAGGGASDDNGGGFKSDAAGTDYSTAADGPQATLTANSLVNAVPIFIDVHAGDYT